MMRNLTILALAGLSLSWGQAASAQSLDIEGTWFTKDNEAKVEVSDCGDGTPCGKLVWFDPNLGGDNRDMNNPDPELQGRPLLNTAVFWGFERSKNKWKSGKIYDAQSGKTYKSKLELQDDGTLKVKGCVGPICQGQTWVKVPDEVTPE